MSGAQWHKQEDAAAGAGRKFIRLSFRLFCSTLCDVPCFLTESLPPQVGRNGTGKTTLLRALAGHHIKGIPHNTQARNAVCSDFASMHHDLADTSCDVMPPCPSGACLGRFSAAGIESI